QLAGAGDVGDLQVFGDARVARGIGEHRERRARDHHRPDRETVEAVGQVHGVGGACNDQSTEWYVPEAEIGANVLQERHRDVAAVPGPEVDQGRGDAADA